MKKLTRSELLERAGRQVRVAARKGGYPLTDQRAFDAAWDAIAVWFNDTKFKVSAGNVLAEARKGW